MRPPPTIETNLCYPLQEDSELAEAVDPELRATAVGQLVARQLEISPGSWPGIAVGSDGIGMLVLQGVLARAIQGNASSVTALEAGRRARPLAEQAWALVQQTFDA